MIFKPVVQCESFWFRLMILFVDLCNTLCTVDVIMLQLLQYKGCYLYYGNEAKSILNIQEKYRSFTSEPLPVKSVTSMDVFSLSGRPLHVSKG